MSKLEDNPIETVRLSDRDKQKLIDRIEQQAANTAAPCERRNTRVQYHNPNLLVMLSHPSGLKIKHVMVARNLSRWGIAFIHGRFVYQDSECIVTLTSLSSQESRIVGKVIRCRHVGGIMHEISVLFDTPIELDAYIARLPNQQHCNEEQPDTQARNNVQDAKSALIGDGTDPIFSIHADVTPMRPLIESFVTSLGEYISQLNQANAVEDFDQLHTMCSQLNSAGGNFGFDQIKQISHLAVEHLSDQERDVHAISETVDDLLGILRRVRFE